MEEHVCPELRDLNVASGNTQVTCLHTSLGEIDRYQAVCPILGQGPIGNNYEYPETRISLNGRLSSGRAAAPEEHRRSPKVRLGFTGVILCRMTSKEES